MTTDPVSKALEDLVAEVRRKLGAKAVFIVVMHPDRAEVVAAYDIRTEDCGPAKFADDLRQIADEMESDGGLPLGRHGEGVP